MHSKRFIIDLEVDPCHVKRYAESACKDSASWTPAAEFFATPAYKPGDKIPGDRIAVGICSYMLVHFGDRLGLVSMSYGSLIDSIPVTADTGITYSDLKCLLTRIDSTECARVMKCR